jgi:3-oxoacyl-[acyl-carrier protein] reductase
VSYAGKVVVLTGVGREGQVGELIARRFAERGARIVAVDRTWTEVSKRVAELEGAGHEARAFAGDLTDEGTLARLGADVAADCGGRIDALVHAAGGYAESGPVGESDFAVWQRQFAINLTTAYLATRAFLPLLRPARGAIVYFASEAALPGAKVAGRSAYAAAKSGVVTLMRAVAGEERPNGVRANALAPGAIRTAANVAAMGAEARFVERDDVANAVLFLCSDEARAVTGQLIALG